MLLDEGRLEELFSLVSLEDIADAWCRYESHPHRAGSEEEDADWWAVELLTDIDHYLGPDEHRVRSMIDLLVDRASNDALLGIAAAGPVEDFVKSADEDRLLWIEGRAAKSTRFRQALRGVAEWHATRWDVIEHQPLTLRGVPQGTQPSRMAIVDRIQRTL